jgi:hypothetical protein
VCLLEEREILSMRNGDQDLRDTIQDHRQVWKRHALDLSPFLRQPVKRQYPANGGGDDGVVSTEVHTGVQAGGP